MEILNVIGSLCSMISLMVALFIGVKVIKIEKNITISKSVDINGKENVVAEGNVNVKRK